MKKLHHPALFSGAIAVLIFAVVWGLQCLGAFQSLELYVYDHLIRTRPSLQPTDPRIAIVEVTEADILKYDFPIPDAFLAKILDQIASQNPRAIGVDIFRDVSVPRDGSGRAALEQTLAAHPNLIWIFKFGDPSADGVAPPPWFQNSPERIAFNDYPLDATTTRRGLLFLDDGKSSFESLALRLVELYLAGENPPINLEPDPSNAQLLRLGRTTFHPFKPTDGGYVSADSAGYQYFLDFAGPRKFTTYSLDDLLSGRSPKDFATNRIVLLGSTAGSVKDFVVTPLGINQPGVKLHAQAINQLLRAALTGDLAVRTWSDAKETAWLLLWCCIGAITAYFCRTPWRLVVLLSVAITCLVLIVWYRFSVGWWTALSPPLIGNLFTAGLVMAYMAYLEKRDRGVLMDLFKRNVSPGVAQSLWNQRMHFTQNGRPRPQMLTATILFTDLKNFTTTSEHLGPEALMEWLNGYFHVIVGEIDSCSGVVMKYIGDAVMAAFGVPIPRETEEEINQDAINAVRCALGMEKALAKLNKERVLTGAPKASMRVGIFTGHVVAGCLGSATRIEYTTIGDTTNTASRLESFDKDYEDPTLPPTDCRILIGEPTKQRIGNRFVTKLLGNLELKGKKEKVTVYRVLSEQTTIDEP